MRLKELKLYGFKSFPEKTTISLAPGITALVGPNGCGKSNVLDAIRWVLGEQTLSQLRCAKSEDLIFAGSGRHSAQGYAEVSLVIENQNDFSNLPAEVELKRRYYRSGESSFWINREECRLKEIEAILRGGAAGGRLYSIFDARKLASIVGGELQNLMESAAGVLGFRQQRKEAEAKLKLVSRDLTRLDDIIGERKRIVRSLSRQRRRAQLFAELRERKVALEALGLRVKLAGINEGINLKTKHIADLEERERKLVLSQENYRNLLKENDNRLSSLLTAEKQARGKLSELNQNLSDISAELSALTTRREALTESLATIAKDTHQAVEKIEEIKTLLNEVRKDEAEALGRKTQAEELLKTARENLTDDEEKLAVCRKKVTELREALRKITSELSGKIEERTRISSRGENASSLANTAREELAKFASKASELRTRLKTTEESLASVKTQLQSKETDISNRENKLSSLNIEIKDLDFELRKKVEESSKLSGQIASLKDKIDNKPRRQLRNMLGDKFKGLMEEMLSYPRELEVALEAIFYDILGFAAADNIPDIKGISLDGQTGLVLSRQSSDSQPERIDDIRFKAWLADKVKLKPHSPELLNIRLKQWVLADEDDLIALSNQYPTLSFVSLSGTAIRGDGVVVLGRSKGVLAERRKLNELEALLQELSRKISAGKTRLTQLRKSREDMESRLDEERKHFFEQRSERNALQAELERLKSASLDMERDRERLRRDAQTREEEAQKALSGLEELDKNIFEMEGLKTSLENELAEAEKRLIGFEETLREKLAGLNDNLLGLAAEEEAEHAARNRRERLEEELKRLEAMLIRKKQEKEIAEASIVELKTKITLIQQERSRLLEQRRDAENIMSEIDTGKLLEEKHNLESKLEECREELAKLREKLVSERTENLLLQREREEIAPMVSTLGTNYEADEQKSAEEVTTQLADVSRRLADLGIVNEYAAIQFEEEKAELDKIKAQQTDILQASESLNAIIANIDGEARTRYENTFKQVREEFRRTFNFFFPGGEANLRFENPDDPFNSAIHITAKPEGKQLKRLAQLSDGERTMLGISLLFSFYAVRPAPFLFVDELDAPLDDNNVLKFASFLARVKDKIQIFAVTHNKRTMEKADSIYGVTMEEPGVSKIISVKLKDVKRHHVAVEET